MQNRAPSLFAVLALRRDRARTYIGRMRALLFISLFGLLAVAVWFAGSAFVHFGGEPIPVYGYVAIAGGVVFSLLVGGGLMALVFYSSRHGYDDGTPSP